MKGKIALLLAASLLVSSLSASVTAINAQSTKPSAESLWERFLTPPDDAKSHPLWFWNESLNTITKQGIHDIMVNSKTKSGYAGFSILPDWVDNYMSDQYLDLYGYALQTAKELGMKMCLYDENGFPSGNAGGLLEKDYPADTLKRLDKQEKDIAGPGQVAVPIPAGEYRTYLGAVAVNTDTNEIIDISDSAIFADDTAPGVYSSSDYSSGDSTVYTADQAFDGDDSSRWNAKEGNESNQWLEVRYAQDTTVDKIAIREALDRINSYAIQYYNGTGWVDIDTGTAIGSLKEITFAPVTARRFRLMMYSTKESLPSIYEMELFNGADKIATPTSDNSGNYDRVVYNAPQGNWKVMTFATVKDGSDLVDYLDKQSVDDFISITHQAYYDHFSSYFGNVIDTAEYDEPPLYHAQGRTWTGDFNKLFEAQYGYDPITLYPSLWYDIGENTQSARNALLGFRADLFSINYVKEMNDWCNAHGIKLTGHIDQEENVNPVSSDGDLMKVFKYQDIPGIDEISSYNRANKAFKIVSSSADNWDKGLVFCETYGAMGENMGIPTMYKEAMNQFAKGINYLVPHAVWYNNTSNIQFPPELSYRSAQYGPELSQFNDFVGRCSTLLQNSRHVADIGVLYPINTLQAGFVFDVGDPYTGNVTPEEADYMDVGDLLSTTIRRDFTFLHPEVVADQCTVDGDTFKLNNEMNYENYKVLILPGSKTISWEALKKVREFYDNGGKVIATTQLPYMSSEPGHNKDVVDTVKYMFNLSEDDIKQVNKLQYRASSCFQNNPQYAAAKAFDGTASDGSRWNAGDMSGGGQWLEVDFGEPTAVNKAVLKENAPYRVTQYRIQYWDGSKWADCSSGTSIGAGRTNEFNEVTTTKLRLTIDSIKSDSASIQEFEVYDNDSGNLALPVIKTADHSNDKSGKAIFLGKNYRGTLKDALDECVGTFDVDIDNVATQGGDLTYIHKVQGDTDLYYFANSSDNAVSTYVNIRKTFEKPMVWDPYSGTKYAPDYTVVGDVTKIRLSLKAVQSVFIVDENAADKTALQNLYDSTKDREQGDYTEESWSAYKTARLKAETVLADPSSSQADIETAFTNLSNAVAALVANTSATSSDAGGAATSQSQTAPNTRSTDTTQFNESTSSQDETTSGTVITNLQSGKDNTTQSSYSSPGTGDNPATSLLAGALAVSFAGAAATYKKKKKS